MSGNPEAWGLGWFVVVWEYSNDTAMRITQVTRWDEWLRVPFFERPRDTTMVKARDELDAFVRAERGEKWDNEGAS